MTAEAQELLRAARALPPHEQLELLEDLAQLLAQALSPLGPATAQFWASRSLDEIAHDARTSVVTDLAALALADWPRAESEDDLLAYIRDQRRADRDR